MSLRTLIDALAAELGADYKALRGDVPKIARGPSFAPRVGWSISGGLMLGTTAGTPSFQRATFTPFPVGPSGWTTDAALFVVSTAYAGGTGVAFQVGIYPDDGSGFPNLAGGPLAQLTTTALTAGNKAVAFGAPLALVPGLYWIGTLVQGSAAPSAGQMQCVTNNAYQLSLASTFAPGTSTRAYTLPGQAALPTAQPADSSFSISGGNDSPLIALRRSA